MNLYSYEPASLRNKPRKSTDYKEFRYKWPSASVRLPSCMKNGGLFMNLKPDQTENSPAQYSHSRSTPKIWEAAGRIQKRSANIRQLPLSPLRRPGRAFQKHAGNVHPLAHEGTAAFAPEHGTTSASHRNF